MYYSIYYLPSTFQSAYNIDCTFCITTAKGFYYINSDGFTLTSFRRADKQTFDDYGRVQDYAVASEGILCATSNSYEEFIASYPEFFI